MGGIGQNTEDDKGVSRGSLLIAFLYRLYEASVMGDYEIDLGKETRSKHEKHKNKKRKRREIRHGYLHWGYRRKGGRHIIRPGRMNSENYILKMIDICTLVVR